MLGNYLFLGLMVLSGFLAYSITVFIRKALDGSKPKQSKREQIVVDEEITPVKWKPLFTKLEDKPSSLSSHDKQEKFKNKKGKNRVVFSKSVPIQLDLSTLDVYNHTDLKRKDTLNSLRDSVEHFGVGSCGPREFCGTMTIHQYFEKRVAAGLGFEQGVLYSSLSSLIISMIRVLADNRKSVVLYEKNLRQPYLTTLDQCNSKYKAVFESDAEGENDISTVLNACVKSLAEELCPGFLAGKPHSYKDKNSNPFKKVIQMENKFIILETLCFNTGRRVSNNYLKKLLGLANYYGFYVILDQTYGLGLSCEITPCIKPYRARGNIISFIGLEAAAFASKGAICLSTNAIADLQRLGSSGYIFSASNPPFLVTQALKTWIWLHNRLPYHCKEMSKVHDLDASMMKEGDPEKLFDENGDPTALKQVTLLLESVQKICQLISKHGVKNLLQSNNEIECHPIFVFNCKTHSQAMKLLKVWYQNLGVIATLTDDKKSIRFIFNVKNFREQWEVYESMFEQMNFIVNNKK